MTALTSPVPGVAPGLSALERGVLWPVVYASVFGAPVPSSKLWERIAGVRATEEDLRKALSSQRLRDLLREEDGQIWLRQAEPEGAREAFSRRVGATRKLLVRHEAILRFVRGLPWVRFSALSGGCAHEAAADSDIDVFVVTEPGAVWRTLLWSTLVSKARGWRRVLCMNYLVDETARALPWRDFYGGFELISLRPLNGDGALPGLLAANSWVEPMFPNFFHSRVHGQNQSNTVPAHPRGQSLETIARMIHRPYLRLRLPQGSGVELSDRAVRLHAVDHKDRVRGLFQDALQRIGMEAPPWI